MKQRRVILSESDFTNLNALVDALQLFRSNDSGCLNVLESDLEGAEVLKPRQMPTNVVSMNSQVHVMDLDSGEDLVYTVVFPQDADMEHHRVSVLAPLGAALVGSRVGQVITPMTPRGRRRLRVGAIVYRHDTAPAALEEEVV
jgi:regulator of nucleoside diphosphate kinase